MRKVVATALFVMISLLPAFAADPPASGRLTLAECLQIAEKEQPDLAAARALIVSTQQEIQIAKAGYRPHLDSGTSYTRQSYNYTGTPGTPPRLVNEFSNGESMKSAPYYYLGMNLSQTIYDFGLTRGSVRRGQADSDAAQQNYQRVHDLVYLNVRQAYHGVLAAQELLEAQQDAVASQQKHLEQVRSFYQAGTRPKIDVTNQELALARSQVDLRQAQANLDVARAALATAMGIPIQQAPEPVEALEENREPVKLDKLLVEAEQKRPDIAVSRDQVFAAQADIIVARSAFRPSLGLSGFFNYRNLQLPLIYNWSLAGLVAQSLLDGGIKRAHVAQAQAQEVVAKANLDSLVQKVRQEVFADLSNVQVARDKVFLTEQAEKEAEESLALAEGRYTNGYGNIIELTDAQFLLTDSRVNQIATRYEYQMAVASLDVAVGRTPVK